MKEGDGEGGRCGLWCGNAHDLAIQGYFKCEWQDLRYLTLFSSYFLHTSLDWIVPVLGSLVELCETPSCGPLKVPFNAFWGKCIISGLLKSGEFPIVALLTSVVLHQSLPLVNLTQINE